jgi:hypothetical protein
VESEGKVLTYPAASFDAPRGLEKTNAVQTLVLLEYRYQSSGITCHTVKLPICSDCAQHHYVCVCREALGHGEERRKLLRPVTLCFCKHPFLSRHALLLRLECERTRRTVSERLQLCVQAFLRSGAGEIGGP